MAITQLELGSQASKELFSHRSFSSIMFLEWLISGAKQYQDIYEQKKHIFDIPLTYSNGFLSVFMDSDLHKTFNLLSFKANTKINGKYTLARLYLFETEHFYIAATCETGQRGSDWLFVEKENINLSKGYSNGNELFMIKPKKMKELVMFFQEMAWHLFEYSSQSRQDELKQYNAQFINQLEKKFAIEKTVSLKKQ